MIYDEFIKVFKEKLKHKPTKDQEDAIHTLAKFTLNIEQQEMYILKGYAGTGKTTLIDGLVKATNHFKIKTILMAPTGRAAKVINKITGKIAYTIHKKIYRQKSSKDGFGSFALGDNLHTNTIFIVDEASMIANNSLEQSTFGSGRLLEDLISFVFSGERCKLIFIGDTAQLPPVKLNISPALDTEALKMFMYPVFTNTLTEVVRQEKDSGILYNATKLRELLNSDKIDIKINTLDFDDIHAINGGMLIEDLNTAYDKDGLEQSIIVCRSNKRANRFNQGIRNTILYREERIAIGDLIMVVKNNYFWTEDEFEIDFIANGDIAEITHIFAYETLYGFDFADISIRLIDYDDTEVNVKILLNTLESETAALSFEENKNLFYKILEDYSEIKPKSKQYKEVRENPYFNALQIKYAYAITCHKAQGGQWKNVFIDQGYINDEMIDKEYLRWLYTAFTRPTEELFLINFSPKMLDFDDF
jgi:exodeoxyribonuclease-5